MKPLYFEISPDSLPPESWDAFRKEFPQLIPAWTTQMEIDHDGNILGSEIRARLLANGMPPYTRLISLDNEREVTQSIRLAAQMQSSKMRDSATDQIESAVKTLSSAFGPYVTMYDDITVADLLYKGTPVYPLTQLGKQMSAITVNCYAAYDRSITSYWPWAITGDYNSQPGMVRRIENARELYPGRPIIAEVSDLCGGDRSRLPDDDFVELLRIVFAHADAAYIWTCHNNLRKTMMPGIDPLAECRRTASLAMKAMS